MQPSLKVGLAMAGPTGPVSPGLGNTNVQRGKTNALRGKSNSNEANQMSDEANLNGARKMPSEANSFWFIEYKEFY